MTTEERIVDEADKYGFQVPYDGTSEFYDRSAVKAYIVAAKSERNKTIDEAIESIKAKGLSADDYNGKIIYELLNSMRI